MKLETKKWTKNETSLLWKLQAIFMDITANFGTAPLAPLFQTKAAPNFFDK